MVFSLFVWNIHLFRILVFYLYSLYNCGEFCQCHTYITVIDDIVVQLHVFSIELIFRHSAESIHRQCLPSDSCQIILLRLN
jgi:hypothetical protein